MRLIKTIKLFLIISGRFEMNCTLLNNDTKVQIMSFLNQCFLIYILKKEGCLNKRNEFISMLTYEKAPLSTINFKVFHSHLIKVS